MPLILGGCRCGNVRISAELTRPLESYNPRECDCDFCRTHSAAYISDYAGSLTIAIRDAAAVRRSRQGDALADMLICGHCGVLIGALYTADGQQHGVVNVQAVEGANLFGARQTVSPRKLSAAEKTSRWQQIWFPNVVVRS